MQAIRFDHIEQLGEPGALEQVLGPVAEVARAPQATTTGFSGSRHERFEVRLRTGRVHRLFLKITPVAGDWISRRSGDRQGREGLLLGEPSLAGVWDVFHCPHVAWAQESGTLGLLMWDLTDHLLPDVREPVSESEEASLLGALAALHARFWQSPALDLAWLGGPTLMFDMISHRAPEEEAALGPLPPVLVRCREGWAAAFALLPSTVARLLREPPDQLAERFADLPRTLLHGDSKVANFALLPHRGVAAFDWSNVSAAPVGVELGWYLAVNATRLAAGKEATIARYRTALETSLGAKLPDATWNHILDLAVVTGATTLLWNKALALETGGARARAEWNWWVERLAAL